MPLGIVGGSSFAKSPLFSSFTKLQQETPFGAVLVSHNETKSVFFVQRHAADPEASYSQPHLVNKRAIVHALHALGCERIVGFGSVGSLKTSIPVGSLMLPEDYLDPLTHITFFDDARAHIVPRVDANLRQSINDALSQSGIRLTSGVGSAGGIYTQTQGPRFETPAEIAWLAKHGDVVGMTCGHEATLAAELSVPYAMVCMVDNMANGVAAKSLGVDEFHDGVARNLATMERVLGCVLRHLDPTGSWPDASPETKKLEQPAKEAHAEQEDEKEPEAEARPVVLGVIAGSSFLKSPYFCDFETMRVDTPFGAVKVQHSEHRDVFFVQRHAADPAVSYSPPHLINKRAIVHALHELGCTQVLAFGSVGSLNPNIPVGSLMVPDDYFAPWTQVSFFTDFRSHIVPGFNIEFRSNLLRALAEGGHRVTAAKGVSGGVYGQTQGPRFETPAEIAFLGREADIVGMTCGEEATLCAELKLPYSVVCMVDNMANGVAAKSLGIDQFHDGVARNLATMEAVLGCLLRAVGPKSAKWPDSVAKPTSPAAHAAKPDTYQAPAAGVKLGVIGGSSFLKSPYFKSFVSVEVETPFGAVQLRRNADSSVYFVQRHAADPSVDYSPPHLVNKRAIIRALKDLGCENVLAFGSVGSLKPSIPVGSLLVPDDYFDPFVPLTFFDDYRAHLVPGFHQRLRSRVLAALDQGKHRVTTACGVSGGVYLQTRGPRFETQAEIAMYGHSGDVVGMTCAHEAVLCAELGLPYAVVCMVDNMANGVAAKTLGLEQFHDGVARNLETMESVLGCLLTDLTSAPAAKPSPPVGKEDADKTKPVVMLTRSLPASFFEDLRAVARVAMWNHPSLLGEHALHQDAFGDDLSQHTAGNVSLEDITALLTYIFAPVNDSLLDLLPNLKVVSNFGVGVNHIDLDACTKRGVIVGHTPDCLNDATADLGMALLLAAARNLFEGDRIARRPDTVRYDPNWMAPHDVTGACVGVVGLGRIGAQVARRCAAGFNMRVLYHNRSRAPPEREAEAGGAVYCDELPKLLSQADFVVVVVPGGEKTRHIINSEALAAMKSGAALINISRGSTVDQDALVSSLQSGHLGCAALDVTEPEPLPRDHALLTAPNVILTPHIGSATKPTRSKMMLMTLANLRAGLAGQQLPTAVIR